MFFPRLISLAVLLSFGLASHAGTPHQNTPVERFGALLGAELLASYSATRCRDAMPHPDDYESPIYNGKLYQCLAAPSMAGREAMWAELSKEPEFARMDPFARQRAREAFFSARPQDTMQGFHDSMRALRLSLGDPVHGKPGPEQLAWARSQSARITERALPIVVQSIAELYRLEALNPRFVARAAQDPDNTTSEHARRSLDIAIDTLADAWLVSRWSQYHDDMASAEEQIEALRRLAKTTERVPKADIADKINQLRARQQSWASRARAHGEATMASLGLSLPADTD